MRRTKFLMEEFKKNGMSETEAEEEAKNAVVKEEAA